MINASRRQRGVELTLRFVAWPIGSAMALCWFVWYELHGPVRYWRHFGDPWHYWGERAAWPLVAAYFLLWVNERNTRRVVDAANVAVALLKSAGGCAVVLALALRDEPFHAVGFTGLGPPLVIIAAYMPSVFAALACVCIQQILLLRVGVRMLRRPERPIGTYSRDAGGLQ